MVEDNKAVPSKKAMDDETLFQILDSIQTKPVSDPMTQDAELISPESNDTKDFYAMPELPVEDLELLLIPAMDDEDDEYPAPRRIVSRPRAQRSISRSQRVKDADEELPPAPVHRRNPFVVLWENFSANLPRKGDNGATLARKVGFLLSLVVLLVSVGYLVADLWIRPMRNDQLKAELENLYQPQNSMLAVDTENKYPEGMLASFKELYNRNEEVRGWVTFHANGKTDFLNIDYPVVYSGDNEKYLTLDFDEKKNKNGALFFDENNRLSSRWDKNKSLIIYGHNMASGQMFAGLNKLMGNLSNARAASMFSLSTLFRQDEYMVFAVIVTDEAEDNAKWYFNTRRTEFDSDEDFLDYIEEMRARSMFDYPVEVRADDEIVVLSTCTNKNSAKVKDGRLVVVARRRRAAEADVDTTKIVKNEDVIMPRNWYVNQQLPLHAFYENDYEGTSPTTTTAASTTTTESFADDTTTTRSETTTDRPNPNSTNLSIHTTTTTVPSLTVTTKKTTVTSSTTTTVGTTTGTTTTTVNTTANTTTSSTTETTTKTTTSSSEVSVPENDISMDVGDNSYPVADESMGDNSDYIVVDRSDVSEDVSDYVDTSGAEDDSSTPDTSN